MKQHQIEELAEALKDAGEIDPNVVIAQYLAANGIEQPATPMRPVTESDLERLAGRPLQ